jgi:ketosteroid isomerase-like protein
LGYAAGRLFNPGAAAVGRCYNTAMESTETRALVQRFLDARAANNRDEIAAVLSEDVEWQPPKSAGFGPFRGREKVADALAGGAMGRIMDMSTMKRTVHKLIVEGDTAVALQHLSATTRKGASYENEYAWVYTCADDKITRLVEHADTLNAALILGSATLTPRPPKAT